MEVYVYQSDLICKPCGERVREELRSAGKAPLDPEDETSYDSDDYPKGPYPDGGGEADVPYNCGMDSRCVSSDTNGWGAFLDNPLTSAGVEFVREAIFDGSEMADVWLDAYGDRYGISHLKCETNTPVVRKLVEEAARENFERDFSEAFFEHGQWWVRIEAQAMGGDYPEEMTYSVVDAEPGVLHGLDFEAI